MQAAASGSRLVRGFLLLGRLGLGLMFVYAAYTKLWAIHPDADAPLGMAIEWRPWAVFAMSINSYQMLPEWAVVLVARTLPWFELVLGVLLLAGYQLRFVAAGASGLLTFFFVVMLRSYFKGQSIDCGCFGVGEALSTRTLARDGILVALSLVLTVAAFLRARRAQPA